jgi:glycosyltransferase involved in cell wall biosynthesis
MSKRKVCVFCETWASGGIESFLTGVLLRQDMGEMEIDLVTAEQRSSVYTPPLEEHGVRFIPLSGSPWNLARNQSAFRRLLAEKRYDAVYVNAFHALSLRYGLLAKRAGVPVRILHSHGADIRRQPLRPLKLLLHRIARELYRDAGTMRFACSDEAAAFLFPPRQRENGGVRFLPNGIDTGRFRFQAEARSRIRGALGLEERFVLGYMGRLSDEKNPMFLLEVLDSLLPLRPDACLLLAGEGKLRQALEERAAELGVLDRVLFYGVTDKPWELYWAMDVFLFPSLFEGLGIAAVEAQCAGLPLLCSEHVPAQALITPLAHRTPLTGGGEAWAKAVLALETPADRENCAFAVRAAGFDIETVSRTVRAALMGEKENGAAAG